MKISSFFLSAALGAALFASPAHAADFVVVYKGTVYDSFQFGLGTNTFGNNGASLNGAAFEARFEVNTPTPGPGVTIDTNYGLYFLSQGLSAPSLQTASIKLNGVTVQFPSSTVPTYSFSSNFWRYNPSDEDLIRNGVSFTKGSAGPQYAYQDERLALGVRSLSNGLWTSSALSNSFNYTLNPGDNFTNVGGEFSFFSIDRTLLNGQRELVNGALAISSVSMNFSPVPAAVPELATWAMMIIGFGAVGAGMRRRKANTVLA